MSPAPRTLLLLLAVGCRFSDDRPRIFVDTGAVEAVDEAVPGYVDAGGAVADEGWDRANPEHVCHVWQRARQDRRQGSWDGDAETCHTGDNDVGRAFALAEVNLTRWLAGLPDTHETDPQRDYAAQQCAVMMHGQEALSHLPSDTWACHTGWGATAAERGLLASAPATESIDLYLVDEGHPDTLGHRRWLLSNELGNLGIGTTSHYSCLWVVEGDPPDAGAPWVAWPPPGPAPAELMRPSRLSGLGLDDTGWSVQSDAWDLAGASVTVWEDGVQRPVETWDLLPWMGSRSAIAFAPAGWRSGAGHAYDVEVKGGGTTIRYTVEIVGCDG